MGKDNNFQYFNQDNLSRLSQIIDPEHIKTNEPMSAHTTFRAGGPAEVFISPDEEELAKAISFAKENDIPYRVIGNGSNLLVSDKGLSGMVIAIGSAMSDITIEGNTITAGAGAMLSSVANAAANASLTGMEFSGGIPGTLGGGVVMNAGAYGGEIKDVIVSAKILMKDGQIRTIKGEDLHLSYRHSIFMEEENECEAVISAVFSLEKGDEKAIRDTMSELLSKRKEKQPLEYPSAGSTFKRPEGYFAGKLIQDAGLKGFAVGGAEVSEKHSGFVINKNNATASEIYELICRVQDEVEKQSGIRLSPEVRILGEF